MRIDKKRYGLLPGDREVTLFTLTNDGGMEVDVINYGAIIPSIRLPGRGGEKTDVVLGFDSLEGYLGDHPYIGAMVGRVCNRIGGARFELDGREVRVSANEGSNHLHGGNTGFDKKLWTASVQKSADRVSVTLGLESGDGEEGYPGNLLAETEYSLNNQNELGIRCRARTDRPTHVNLTNHSYFNLNNGEGTILDHLLTIDAPKVTELDEMSIPTGRIREVEGTPYDFRKPLPIGERIAQVPPGYDINYVLSMNRESLRKVAILAEPVSGRSMEVWTTLPGIQLYTSNHIDRIEGKDGRVYGQYSAVCLETQYFPDSCNNPGFPSTLLTPAETYEEETVYRFFP